MGVSGREFLKINTEGGKRKYNVSALDLQVSTAGQGYTGQRGKYVGGRGGKDLNVNVGGQANAFDFRDGLVFSTASVAEVQFRTDAENQNRRNRTESSVQSGSGSPVLAAVRFSVLRILQNS